MELPTIDGHFWVVRDGKIVDWDFPEFSQIFRTWGCVNQKKYLPAPEMTQKLIIGMFKKAFSSFFSKSQTWDEIMNEYAMMSKMMRMADPEFSRCYQNCLLEIQKNGGELVFGSLGFKFKKSNEFHYEWGGENYTKVVDFIQK